MEHTTVNSRGTASYRAPELLAPKAAYTNKVDIWALGCITYELMNAIRAFHDDWAVMRYMSDSSTLALDFKQLPSNSAFAPRELFEIAKSLFTTDFNQRRLWKSTDFLSRIGFGLCCYTPSKKIGVALYIILRTAGRWGPWNLGMVETCSGQPKSSKSTYRIGDSL